MRSDAFEIVSEKLADIALRERLDIVKTYMADFDDAAWRDCFDSEKDAWTFLGPLYKNKSLRVGLPANVNSYLAGFAQAAE